MVVSSLPIMKTFDMKSNTNVVVVSETQSRSLPGVLAFYDSHSGRE